MKKHVLIVEDNVDLVELIQLHLHDINCTSDVAYKGDEALQKYQQNIYDLILLDIMLPVIDGVTLCKKFRESGVYVPIIMLTSKSSEVDRVVGLEVGADDYITKPFSIPELLARIKARFRSSDAYADSLKHKKHRIELGDLSIDLQTRMVTVAAKNIELTAKEFDLLVYFAQHAGQVFSRNQLLDNVWGYHFEGYEHTVNTHINRLRLKIEPEPSKPKYILTVWGVGYKFDGNI